MLLRSKRQPEGEIRDEPLPEPSDLISTEDIFPEDGLPEEGGAEDGMDEEVHEARGPRLLAAVPGPLIAAVTFVPTFLVIFFGLSFLVGLVAQTTAPGPSAALMPELGSQGPPPASEALRDPFVAPRTLDTPPARPRDPREPQQSSSMPDSPAPAIESPGPTLPPAQPRPAISPQPGAGRPVEAPRQPQAAVLNTTPERTPAVQAPKGGRDWTPAAAFADREAASRLAGSIRQQGYPVEIRQEQSSARPWVVWIGARPRGAERGR